jgi:hypothetical protein
MNKILSFICGFLFCFIFIMYLLWITDHSILLTSKNRMKDIIIMLNSMDI